MPKIWIRIIAYLFIAFVVTYILFMSIGRFKNYIFWFYIVVMGFSAIITRWNISSERKNGFVRIMEHTAYICALILILFWLSTKF